MAYNWKHCGSLHLFHMLPSDTGWLCQNPQIFLYKISILLSKNKYFVSFGLRRTKSQEALKTYNEAPWNTISLHMVHLTQYLNILLFLNT